MTNACTKPPRDNRQLTLFQGRLSRECRRVMDVLRGIDEEPYPRIILAPLEIAGVDPVARLLYRPPDPTQDVPERPMARVTQVHRLAEPADTSAGA